MKNSLRAALLSATAVVVFSSSAWVLGAQQGGAQAGAAAHRVGQLLMPRRRILGPSHHTEPDRRQRVRLLDRIQQRRASRALRDPCVELLMHRLIQRTVHLHRQLIHAHRQLLQLGALAGRGDLREPHGRLHFERLADDVVSLHVFG